VAELEDRRAPRCRASSPAADLDDPRSRELLLAQLNGLDIGDVGHRVIERIDDLTRPRKELVPVVRALVDAAATVSDRRRVLVLLRRYLSLLQGDRDDVAIVHWLSGCWTIERIGTDADLAREQAETGCNIDLDRSTGPANQLFSLRDPHGRRRATFVFGFRRPFEIDDLASFERLRFVVAIYGRLTYGEPGLIAGEIQPSPPLSSAMRHYSAIHNNAKSGVLALDSI
jgi:hypothetical protein